MEEDNLENEHEQPTSTEQMATEVGSKKISWMGKVITITPKKEIAEIVGEKLTNKEARKRLITQVLIEGSDDVASKIRENGEQEKVEKKDEKKNYKAKRIIPIALVLLLPLIIHSCSKNITIDETTIEDTPVTLVESIDMPIYDVDNPYAQSKVIVGDSGQEQMVAEGFSGGNKTFYSSDEHYQAETQAVDGVSLFDALKQNVNLNMEILNDQNSSQEQKQLAINELLKLETQAKTMYTNNKDLVEEYNSRFKRASEAFRDSNTDNEIMAADIELQHYLDELGLTSANVEALQEIAELCANGYTLDIEAVEQELDGDYTITGKAIKEVIVEQEVQRSTTLWQKFADFIRTRSNDKER